MTSILFDYQVFSMQRYGGISRYVERLYSTMNAQDPQAAQLALRYAQNEFIPPGLQGSVSPFFHRYSGRGRGRLLRLIDRFNQERVRELLLQNRFDVFHPTYYDSYYLDWGIRLPTVITVHDMIHELFSGHVADPQMAMQKRKTILASDHVICVSESTKKDLMELLPIPEDKVSVIHHGTPFQGDEPENEDLVLPERFILFVGNRCGYKNFDCAVEAFSYLRDNYPDLWMVCAGGGTFSREELSRLAITGTGNRVMWLPASDVNLSRLYRCATSFIFPSLYEGFGFPVLEAMAFGCPVIASNSSSLPEIGADVALYFSPHDVQELSSHIARILDDQSLERELRERGRLHAARFTWENSARKHIEVYRLVSE